jgi:DNA transformation protein
MAVSDTFLEYVVEQLAGLGRVRSRRMFGAVGLYADDLFFGLIDDNALYLRVDDSSRGVYVARGMRPFQPYRDKPDLSIGYYMVPADVIEEPEELVSWARRAVRVAATAPSKTTRRKTSRRKAKPRKAS